ncbi:MAG: glycosyltransferase, partial [Lachnospiraceae bacterium]|nr:glycosyltransferase [Lachnospiraceae bacterium]
KKCDGVIFPTESMHRSAGVIGTRSFILPTGLEEKSYEVDKEKSEKVRKAYIGNKKYLFITVSRVTKEKNIGFMIEAIPLLKAMIGDCFKFLIVGSGDMVEELNSRAMELGIAENVEFTGRIDNSELSDYYGASDLFLFSSQTETQGIVLLEAMAQGVPVVAINATGVCDIIKDGQNGYLSEDDKEDWCKCIVSALDKDELRKGAIQTARQYTCSNIADRATEIYRQVITSYKSYYNGRNLI